MKTPTGYVALRTGRHNIRNCIFLNWLDAEEFIADFDTAEYSVLDSLQDAEKYIINDNSSLEMDEYNNNDSANDVAETRIANAASPPPLGPATIDDICVDDGIEIENPSIANQLSSDEMKNSLSTTNGLQNQDSALTNATAPDFPAVQPAINRNASSGHNKNITNNITNTTHANKALLVTQTAVHVPFITDAATATSKTITTPQNKMPNSNNTTSDPSQGQRGEMYKNWKESFDKYMSYQNPKDGRFPQPIPDPNIQAWLYEQGIEYGEKLQGLPNSLSDERIEMLHSAGVVFFIHESVHEQTLSLAVKKQQQQKPSSPAFVVRNTQQQRQQQQQCNIGCSPSTLLVQKQKPFSSSTGLAGKEQQKQQQYKCSASTTLSVRKQPFASPVVVGKDQQKQQQYKGDLSSTTPESSRPQKRAKIINQQPIPQTWNYNFAKLKHYVDEHDGDWNVTDEDDAPLRSWLLSQKDDYRLMKEGKESTFSEQKLAMLLKIGVDLDKKVYSWFDRVEQLNQYKKENGHFDVPCTHPVLGRWVHNMIQEYEHMCTGKPVKLLNLEKIKELRNAGVDIFNKIDKEKQLIWNGKFESMFYKLKEYKEKHGSTCVKCYNIEYRDLYKWYCKVLAEYRKSLGMDNADTCLLSTRQISRLEEIGFDFTPPTQVKNGSMLPFDERIKQLKEFQRNGGDISKLTVEDTRFGGFIHRQKREYLLWRQGKPSKLNEKKIEVLGSLGIQWDDVEKCVDPNDLGLSSVKKTWDERFQQLLEFKAKHGHVLVPQRTKNCLGIWVKDQRKCYKLMLQGVQGSKLHGMTEERAKKLSDIGFVFDASRGFKQRNRKRKK